MLEAQVKLAVQTALEDLLRHDSYLLVKNVNERSISHCLAKHLQTHFPDWHIDCEYNRNHDDVKRLKLEEHPTTNFDIEGTTVFPDIIVHHRDTDENLLVIEMKKSTSRVDSSYDIKKLNAFKNELGYEFAAFVLLETGKEEAAIQMLTFI